SITEDEISKVENLLDSFVAIYNKNATEYDQKIDKPKSYFKQLIVVINSKGEKEVWVNCFCSASDKSYWKKDIVQVEDGGGCYFQLRVNLTKNFVHDFRVNGIA
ncbi:hypothetical protein, partial [uncultured Mucilaginibacter sp.]|uniref:hypothetical protein n=1 Tax=uncultured Mucilaginibacter sp. TaxID=797541 RepID=UPI0025FB6628